MNSPLPPSLSAYLSGMLYYIEAGHTKKDLINRPRLLVRRRRESKQMFIQNGQFLTLAKNHLVNLH